MATLWLVRRGENTTAPLTTDQLRQCARNGQIEPNDLISKAGTDKWHRAEKVQGLELPTFTSAGEISPPTVSSSDRTMGDSGTATVLPADPHVAPEPRSRSRYGVGHRRRPDPGLETLKRIAKGVAIGFGGVAILVAFVLAVTLFAPQPTGTNRPSETEISVGFEHGMTMGFAMARLGDIKPGTAEIDARARRGAIGEGVPDSERGAYVRAWKRGFQWGWSEGK